MSRSSPVTESARIKIEHPARPAEADYEYADLIRRIETMGSERVVVAILQQYAFAAPSRGSYAGSLWAIAEWLNERITSGHAQCPDLGENREDARKLEGLLMEGVECAFDDSSVTIFISDESDPSVGLDGGLRLSLSCNYEVIPVSLLRDVKAAMGDNWERCLDLWRQTYGVSASPDTSTDRTYHPGEGVSEPITERSQWPTKGDWMRFLGKNGYEYERVEALKIFTIGEKYLVEDCEVHAWSHDVKFASIDGRYNGVMFERVADSSPERK